MGINIPFPGGEVRYAIPITIGRQRGQALPAEAFGEGLGWVENIEN